MQAITYYLALPFIYLLARLPFRALYLLSDAMYYLVYNVLGYRRHVVYTNLKNSFPHKTEEEIRELSKRYFRYFCDLTLETFKTLSFSKEEALNHCRFHNHELFERFYNEKRSIIIVLGHHGNWEWGGNSFSIEMKHHLNVIYRPLNNPYFDKLVYNMRTRFGTGLIEMRQTFAEMVRQKGEITATAFIADQTPPPESAYWTIFLSQETPVFLGAEKIARKLNYPVVFISIARTGRGYYEARAELLFENPAATTIGEITETYTKRLETEIIRQPEIWLWSHRRWKHKKPVAQT